MSHEDDAVELAWGIIANVSDGNWDRQSPEWREMAARWRDKYYGHLMIEECPPPSQEQIDKAFASIDKAWPYLAKHADHIDGEFNLAVGDLRRIVARLQGFAADTTPAVPERGEETCDICGKARSRHAGIQLTCPIYAQFRPRARPEGEDARRMDRFGADRLAGAVCAMIDRGVLDARSEPGDALLDYASARYGDTSPISRVRARYDEIRRGQAFTAQEGP